MKSILLKNWITVILSMLSTVRPTATSTEQVRIPAPVAQVASMQQLPKAVVAQKTTVSVPQMVLHTNTQKYTYVFEGKTRAKATILVSLNTPNNRDLHYTTNSREDGSYSLAVTLAESPNTQVDWTISAQTADSQPVELSGRHILLGDDTVTVDRNLDII